MLKHTGLRSDRCFQIREQCAASFNSRFDYKERSGQAVSKRVESSFSIVRPDFGHVVVVRPNVVRDAVF